VDGRGSRTKSEHEINSHQGGEDQEGHVGHGILERFRRALKTAVDGNGHADALEGVFDGRGRRGERNPGGKVERHGRGDELAPDG